MPHLLLLHGATRPDGNTAAALAHAGVLAAAAGATVETLVLCADAVDTAGVSDALRRADAFLVGTGVYWSSWGSPLQRFLEVVTPLEGSPAFLGKPVGAVVTMDSVGGADVAARLLAAFGQLGCLVPPCATVVLSRVGLAAVAATAGRDDDPNADVWRLDDLGVVVANLLAGAALPRAIWTRWPFEALALAEGPWPAAGPLDLGARRFLG